MARLAAVLLLLGLFFAVVSHALVSRAYVKRVAPIHIRHYPLSLCASATDGESSDAAAAPSPKNQGEFKLPAKVRKDLSVLAEGDGGAEPAFRRRRTPAPASDSLVVLLGTVAGLTLLVAAFLIANQDTPPPISYSL